MTKAKGSRSSRGQGQSGSAPVGVSPLAASTPPGTDTGAPATPPASPTPPPEKPPEAPPIDPILAAHEAHVAEVEHALSLPGAILACDAPWQPPRRVQERPVVVLQFTAITDFVCEGTPYAFGDAFDVRTVTERFVRQLVSARILACTVLVRDPLLPDPPKLEERA